MVTDSGEITALGRVELVNLYHLALSALADRPGVPSPYDRMCWAAHQYAQREGVPPIRAYKALCAALERG